MTIVLMLLLGAIFGALASYWLYGAVLTATSRRTIKQLKDTLEGLEAAHRIELLTLEADYQFTQPPQLDQPTGPQTRHAPRQE